MTAIRYLTVVLLEMGKKKILTAGECDIEGCSVSKYAKGFCRRHYNQCWSTGSPVINRPNPWGSPVERFWKYVEKLVGEGCWIWKGYKDKNGYGKFCVGSGVNISAHRFSYELHYEPIQSGFLVRHLCNNPACCNPKHLAVGSQVDNMRDRLEAGNCPMGEKHPMCKFSDEVVKQVISLTGTYQSIGERFGMSRSQVGNIKRGTQRKIKS